MAASCWSRKLRSRASSSGSHSSCGLDLLVELRGVDLVAPFVLMGEGLLRPIRACVPSSGSVAVGQLVGLLGAHIGRRLPRRPRLRRRCTSPSLSSTSPLASCSSPSFSPSAISPSALVVRLDPESVSTPRRSRRSFSMVRVSCANAFWSRSAPASLSRSLPARFLDEAAPQIDGAARDVGRRSRRSASRAPSGPARRPGAPPPSRAPCARPRAPAALLEPGGEIVRHALHGQRADGFHARLFGGFEQRPRPPASAGGTDRGPCSRDRRVRSA